MLDKTVQRSYSRDPYLYAIWREAGSPAEVKDPWFYGYSTTPRSMQLTRSGIGLRSTQAGIAVRSGVDAYGAKLAAVLALRSDVATTDDGFVVVAPQTTFDGAVADARDRVLIGAELLADLVESEL
ncbi:MAG: hypothetical protein QOE07_1754 [Acidimicrobiaceae bacterium]|nr:hypothetical protein [Acidimicrobiaceae bacterium]